MEKFKNKKTLVMLAVILGSVALIGGGVAFAYFGIGVGGTGNTENNETEVTMVSLGSIYYNGETTFESTDMYPGDIGIQTFKIGPEEQSGIGTYEIDLESVLPDEFGTDVEITLYKTTAPDANNVTVKDGALTTNNSEISRADELVITGTPEVVYGPTPLTDSLLTIIEQSPFDTETMEETTYYLVYNYKNEGDQNDQQGLTFSGTVTVRLILGPLTLTERILLDGAAVDSYPSKDSWVAFDSVKCAYGTQATWDEENWTMVYPEDSGDVCTVSFVSTSQNGTTYLASLLTSDPTTVVEDDYGNIRYIGSDPANYVNFNGENWRIIGAVDVDEAADSSVAVQTNNADNKKLKLIHESIGIYMLDSSVSTLNSGYGINEWSQADMMTTLNTTYLTGGTGTCYGGGSMSVKSCVFDDNNIKPLSAEAQKYLVKAVWNLGTTPVVWQATPGNRVETTIQMYNYERSTNVGKRCTSGNLCNDTVTRTTSWEGYVGLMYPSDYGYATAGGISRNRTSCLNTAMYSLSSYSDCYNNNWLFDSTQGQWTITPVYFINYAYAVFNVGVDGHIRSTSNQAWAVRPVVYLDSEVLFTGGDGTAENPYKLG